MEHGRRIHRRYDCRDRDLHLLLRDLPVRATLIDWSESGVGFHLPGSVAPPRAGQVLECRLVRGDEPLADVDVQIRHLRRDGDHTRVGARALEHDHALLWRAAEAPEHGVYPIAGDADVEAFWKTVFRAPDAFRFRGWGRYAWLSFEIRPKGLLAQPDTFELGCADAAAVVGFEPGRALRLVVSAFGASFLLEVECVAVERDGIVARLPGRLAHLVQRRTSRVPCPPSHPCFLAIGHPILAEKRIPCRVLDLSPQGVAFVADDVPPQFRLVGARQARLDLPHEEDIYVDFTVTSCRTSGGRLVYGAEFARIAERDRRRVVEFMLRAAAPRVRPRHAYDPFAVWDLFGSTGYLALHPAGRPAKPPADAWAALERADGELSRDFVHVADDGIVGHLSCLRVGASAWLLHQLAVHSAHREANAAKHTLYEYAGTFLGARTDDMRYALAFYDPAKPWHRFFFEAFVRRMGDERLAAAHPFRRYDVPTTLAENGHGVEATRAAGADDVDEICTFLVGCLPETVLHALDLGPDALLEGSAGADYAAHGLELRRQVIVQRSGRRLVGVAVCEVATPGLNVFGMLDRATLFQRRLSDDDESAAQRAMIRRVKAFYRDHGRERFHLLVEAGSPDAGIADEDGELIEMTGLIAMSRAGFMNFHNFVRFEFGRLARLRGGERAPEAIRA